MSVYSDFSQTALKYLKDTKANICNILVMTGNFNIRNNLWDPNFAYHSIHRELLFDIADSFFLGLSVPTNCVPIRHFNND